MDSAGGYCQYLEDEIKRTQSDNDWLRQQIDNTRSDNLMMKEELGETKKRWGSPDSSRKRMSSLRDRSPIGNEIGREHSYASSQRMGRSSEARFSHQSAHRSQSRLSRDGLYERDELSNDSYNNQSPYRLDNDYDYDRHHRRNNYQNNNTRMRDDSFHRRDPSPFRDGGRDYSRERSRDYGSSRHPFEQNNYSEERSRSYHEARPKFERSSSFQRSPSREGRRSYDHHQDPYGRDSHQRRPVDDYNSNRYYNSNRGPDVERNRPRDIEQQYLRDSYNHERHRLGQRPPVSRFDSYDDQPRPRGLRSDDSYNLDHTHPIESRNVRHQPPILNLTIKTFNAGRSGESTLRVREDDLAEIMLQGHNFKPTQIEKDDTNKWSHDDLMGKTFRDLNIIDDDVIILSKDDYFEGDWEGTGGLTLHGEARIGGRLMVEMIEMQGYIDMLSCGSVEWYCITRFGRQIIDSNTLSYVPSPDDLGSRIQVVFTSDDGDMFRVTSPKIVILPSIHNLEVLGTLQPDSSLTAVFDLSGGDSSEVTWWCNSTLNDASASRHQRLGKGSHFTLQSHHIGMEIRCEVVPCNGAIFGTPCSITCGVVTRATPVVKDLSLVVMNRNQIHPVAVIDNNSDEELLSPRVQWVIDKTTISKDPFFTFNQCDAGKFLECKYTIRTSNGYCGATANAAVRVPPFIEDRQPSEVPSEGIVEPNQKTPSPHAFPVQVPREQVAEWRIDFDPAIPPLVSVDAENSQLMASIHNINTGEVEEADFSWSSSSHLPITIPDSDAVDSPFKLIKVSDIGKIVTCSSNLHPSVRKSFFVDIDFSTATSLASAVLEGIKGYNLVINGDRHHLILTHKYLKLLKASNKEVLHKSKWSADFRIIDCEDKSLELLLTSKKDVVEKRFSVEAKSCAEKEDLILSFRVFQGCGLSSMCREVFGEAVSSGTPRDLQKWTPVRTAYELYISSAANSHDSDIPPIPANALKILRSMEAKGTGWMESWLAITTLVRALRK
eukprot:TRINITY_DN5167_c6_g1_i1.p1 TRINITY_DN5167_c6_g1~~TRINITY_DN5167_c6_g1_i1.p1  ORF type:complete len:1000 (+),score=161.66 TRINITY_DN5167_c6_g1_i1:41-3040(+)